MSDQKNGLTPQQKINVVASTPEVIATAKLLYALSIDLGIRRFINIEYTHQITKQPFVLQFVLKDKQEGIFASASQDPWIPTHSEFEQWIEKKIKECGESYKNADPSDVINLDHVYWYMAEACSSLLNEERTNKNKAIEEREACLQALSKIQASFKTREWITEGRGVYPFDDDRYRQEVRFIFEELQGIISDVHRQVKSTTCDYRVEVEKQIGSENDRLQKELSDAYHQIELLQKRQIVLTEALRETSDILAKKELDEDEDDRLCKNVQILNPE